MTTAGLSDAEFAQRINVTRQAVHRYKSGDRVPEWDVLARIREATNGEVTPDDFLQPTKAAVAS